MKLINGGRNSTLETPSNKSENPKAPENEKNKVE